MKRILTMLSALLVLAGCGSSNTDVSADSDHADAAPHQYTEVKQAPDKYTDYIKDYVGRNCASIGYESLGGNRMDYIGNGYIRLSFLTDDGRYIGVSDDEIKDYYVAAQSIPANTEVRFTYEKDSSGEEYSNLIEWQSIDEIVLKVSPVGSKEPVSSTGLTAIKPSPDKYTAYVKDYEGRNLGDIGYVSLGGDLRDYYGESNLKLVIITDDGSYVDVMDEESLKQYYVVHQNPAPNTEMTFVFETDSEGNEYSFTKWQSLSEIELRVTRTEFTKTVENQPEDDRMQEESEAVVTESNASENVQNGYEAVYNEYAEKLRSAAPVYIQEYYQEKQSNTEGLSGLAEIANKKVMKLAEISNEGVGELAKVYYSSKGEYSEYEAWAEKLYEVYMEEAENIYNEYMNSVY